MKKLMKLIAIVIIVTSLVGCNKKENDVKVHELESNVTEEKISYNSGEGKESIENNLVETNSFTDENNHTIIYRKYNIESDGMTFSTITVLDKNDKELWKHTTNTVEDLQFSKYQLLGVTSNRVYFKDGEDLSILDTETGKEVKRIKNLGNVLEMKDLSEKVIVFKREGIANISKIYVITSDTNEVSYTYTMPEKYDSCSLTIDDNNVATINDCTNEPNSKYIFNLEDIGTKNWSDSMIVKVK